jgi:hypothetical protein
MSKPPGLYIMYCKQQSMINMVYEMFKYELRIMVMPSAKQIRTYTKINIGLANMSTVSKYEDQCWHTLKDGKRCLQPVHVFSN